jgi:hypothetical protein
LTNDLDFLGIKLIGLNSDAATRLLLTAAFLGVVLVLRLVVLVGVAAITRKHENERAIFWTRQAAVLILATPSAGMPRPKDA